MACRGCKCSTATVWVCMNFCCVPCCQVLLMFGVVRLIACHHLGWDCCFLRIGAAGQTCNAGGANMCPSCSYVCVPCRFFGESHDRTAEGASSASTCCSRATSRTAGWAGSRPSSSRPGRTSCRWCRCCCCCPTRPTRQAARGHPSSSNNASSSCCWCWRC